MKFLKRSLLVLLFLITCLAITMTWIISTTSGLKTAVHLGERLAPGSLSIQSPNGRLLDGFGFTELHYNDGEFDLRISDFAFKWQPSSLRGGTLRINQLAADTIELSLPAEDAAKTSTTDEPLSLPINVAVERLDVGLVHVDAGTTQQTLQQITLNARAQKHTLFIEHLGINGTFNGTTIDITANGRTDINRPWHHDMEGQFTAALPNQPHIAAAFHSQGDITQLQSQLRLEAPAAINVSLNATDVLNRPQWQMHIRADKADLSPWLESATTLTLDMEANGTTDQLSARLQTKLDGAIQQQVNAHTELRLNADDQSLAIQTLQLNSVAQTLDLTSHGNLNYADKPQLDIRGEWSIRQPQPANGQLALKGGLDDYRLDLSADTAKPLDSQWQLNASGTQQSLTIEQLAGQVADGRVQVHGRLDWQGVPTGSMEGNWQNIVIPKALATDTDQDEAIRLPRGGFNIQGTLEDYRIDSHGHIAGANLPAADWQLQAHGDQSRLQMDRLRLALLNGTMTATGQADWSGATPQANTEITLADINPGTHWPTWTGSLNGSSRLQYQQSDNAAWRVTVQALELKGRLRDYPVAATGGAVIEPGRYRLQGLKVSSGNSQLQASGLISDKSQLDFTLNSPDLGQLLPETSGRLQAEGRLSGNYQAPELQADISAEELQSPWLQLAELRAQTDIDATANRFNVSLQASDLERDGRLINKLKFESEGKLSQHTLNLSFEMPNRQVILAGNSGWQDNTWALTLNEGQYNAAIAGDWTLATPLRLTVKNGEMLRSPEHCWRQQKAELCMAADWQASTGWQGSIQLADYHIDSTKTPFEAGKQRPITGDLAFSLRASGREDQIEQLQGNVRLADLTIQTDPEASLRVDQATVDLGGNSTQGLTLALKGQLAAPAPGSLEGHIKTGPLQLDSLQQTGLSGQLNADINNLKPLLALYPRFVTEQASLKADLAIEGSIGAPAFNGDLQLTADDFAVPELGITLTTLALNVRGQPETGLTLEGTATSGPGNINLNGRVTMQEGLIEVPEMSIKGERFQLLSQSQITALVTPDLELQYTGNLLDINGTVLIPEALIQPFGAPGTIPVSEDEVIVTDKTEPAGPGMDIKANIQVTLGDKVSVEGKGFTSRLVGSLDIQQQPRQPATANGELRLIDGGYSAYGQDLTIETGEVIFTGQPIDNPALNIRAVRNVNNVTAGIAVSGNAQQPKTSLFSTPSLPEADILSYIVTGKPLSSAGSGEGNALLAAAASMGLKQTESLQQTIANTLGIDTLEVDTGQTSTGETSARLTVGKYLTPDLYISYGAGLLDTAASTVRLQYSINRHLSLEAEQGTGTGVDLLYQIDSGGWWD